MTKTDDLCTVWTKVVDSQHRYTTRWQICEDDMPRDQAIIRETKGNAYSIEHMMDIKYMALLKGVNPEFAARERAKANG